MQENMGKHTGKNEEREYIIKSEMNCSSNVIYLNTCKTCGLQYLGSTTTKFRMRFNNYKSFFKKYTSGKLDILQSSVKMGTTLNNVKIQTHYENGKLFGNLNSIATFFLSGLNEREVIMGSLGPAV